jgi:predicted NBD/HSP70 family sugar kinase
MSISANKSSNWKSIGLVAIGALGLMHLLTKKSKPKSKPKSKRLIGVELGGTNSKIALIEFSNTDSGNLSLPTILFKQEIKTSTPEETLGTLYNHIKDLDFDAIGIASFGPLNLNKKDPGYGTVTSTPKPGWQNFKMLDFINKHNTKQISIDTDVGAAAAAEYILGNYLF